MKELGNCEDLGYAKLNSHDLIAVYSYDPSFKTVHNVPYFLVRIFLHKMEEDGEDLNQFYFEYEVQTKEV